MVDLTIMGAGVLGLTIAWEAQSRGAKVRVIDPASVGAGSSGGVVGALQPHTPDAWNDKKQFQLESLLMAPALWSAVSEASGLDPGYAAVGRLQPLSGEREVVLARAREAGALTHWGDSASWSVVDTEAAGDWRPPSPTGLFVHDTLSAIVHPRRATQSLAAAVVAKGGEVLTSGNQDGAIVWATGWAGLQELSKISGKAIGNGVKGQAALLAHDAAGAPQIYAENLHIIPHSDGTIGVGSTSEREFDAPNTTDEQLDDIITRAGEIMPVLRGARVIERWAGVRPRASSRAPLLGAWPGRPGQFVANGGFKIGFGMAPKVAEVMCDLILDQNDTIPDGFRLDF